MNLINFMHTIMNTQSTNCKSVHDIKRTSHKTNVVYQVCKCEDEATATDNKAGAGILPSTAVILATGQEDFNDFFWNLVAKYASAAMIALTVLDLLSSIRGDTVQCYAPSN